MDETALVVMGSLIGISLIGYVVVWFFFPEWVGMSGRNDSQE